MTFGPSKIPPPFVIIKFLKDNFIEADDLEQWTPTDWQNNPKILEKIKDPGFKKFAKEVNTLWKKLGRKVTDSVKANQDEYSLIYISNGFILSSSEYKEMYYWDSYWIVRGLLACGMFSTSKGIIENLIYLLRKFHFVPRSNRIYHLNQSQTPTLILMADAYIKATGDQQFMKENIEILERELTFWRNHRSLPVTSKNSSYTMYRFCSSNKGPRPEHYREDYKYMSAQSEASVIMSGLRAAEESSWNFSSRWIDVDGGNEGTIYDVKIQDIIPVDLNAILQKNFKILSAWYRSLGDDKKSGYYELLAEELLIAINNVLWQESMGMWCDYNLQSFEPRRYHYLSNFTPVWTDSHSFDKEKLVSYILRYISDQKLVYYGGVPVSLEFSGEKWDFPNVQPTSLAIFLEGLDNLGNSQASLVAQLLAEMWIDSVCEGFENKGIIYDRYNALKIGYPQLDNINPYMYGHGSTNGVIMAFFKRWGQKLKKTGSDLPKSSFGVEKTETKVEIIFPQQI